MNPILAGAFIDGSASATNSRTRFLGVRLKKFCLWHQFLLKTVESPFMSKGAVTMLDLRIAAGICRLSPFDSRIRKPWLVPSLVYIWAGIASIRLRKRPAAVEGQAPPLNALQRALKKRAEAFLGYCSDYMQAPEYTIIPPPTGKNYAPPTPRGKLDDTIEHAGELISWGIPELQAWAMPIGRANTYRIMARRAAGNDVDVTDDQEREFQKNVPQQFRMVK